MSRTTILHITPNKGFIEAAHISNSWLTAPVVWSALAQRYLAIPKFQIIGSPRIDELWGLWNNEEIPESHRAVLMMTFDKFYISSDDYLRAAKDIKTFLSNFSELGNNALLEIAEMFEEQPDAPAIGFWMTSVSVNPFLGDWNDADEDYGPFDWSTVYSIYSELDKLKESNG